MVKSLRYLLKGIGNHCNNCYLTEDKKDIGERLHEKKFVQDGLGALLNSPNELDRSPVIQEALELCKGCDYGDPNVFHFLEENGIRF